MKSAMAKLMVAVSTAIGFWAAMLPFDAFSEAQPAKNVLVWGPVNASRGGLLTHVNASAADLKEAYERVIPNDPDYASKYPDGIKVTGLVSQSLNNQVDLPQSLDDYALVFVFFPINDVTSNQIARLKTVTERGGRLVLIGEHSNYSATENAVLTRLAKAMGAHFEIVTGDRWGPDRFNSDADLLKAPLKSMPASNRVAPINYSGFAQEIACLKDYPGFVWAVDEASGNGRITVFSDTNWYISGDGGPLMMNSVPFLERILSNAIESEQKVLDGEDPNQDIDEKVPSGMVAAVRDENNFLTYYPTVVSACQAAKAKGYTVVLKREVDESFELPVGVTFDTSEVTTNYAGEVSAPYRYEVRINAAHTIYKVEAVPTPEAPVVSATDGRYPDRVVVTWNEPESYLPVTEYEVRRVKVGSTLEVVLANSVTELTFTDYSAKSGVHYTYRVRAKSDAGWGWFGEDVGWTGQGAMTIPLPVAVDVEEANGVKLCDLEISTSQTDGWYGQDEDTHDGVDAGRSGDVPDNGSSAMTTSVTNAGTLSFWWNVSSEPSDRLSFSVDGAVKAWISGTSRDWEQRSFIIGAGEHEIAWTYAKDASGRKGQDAGWVDQITWKPLYAPGAPGVVNASDGTSTNGIDVTWTPSMSGGLADGYELSRYDEESGKWTVLTNGFVGTAWTDLDVTAGVEYTYRVRASNVAGYGPYVADDGWRRISLSVNPPIVTLGYQGGTTNISVHTPEAWTVSFAENWVSTNNQENSQFATLIVEENTSLIARTNTVTVTAGSGTRPEKATVMVVQGPRPPKMDVGFVAPYEDWRTRMQISTNTTPANSYAPISVFVAGDPLDISFGWTNKSEVAVSMPPVRFKIFKPGNPDPICVSVFTAAGRPGETLPDAHGSWSAWSGHWQNDVLKVLKPGDYMLEAEIDPDMSLGDADRSDNKAVFRFAVRNPALEVGKDIFKPEDGWANIVRSEGNDFAQPPHIAVRAGMAGTNETAIQFGPYVPMNGKNGRTMTQSGKMPLDLVFLIDYTGSMGNCIGGLVNNIGTFIEQLVVGDPANGIEPLDDVRIKIVGFNDTENYSSKDWFVEGRFTTDIKELKNDLSVLRANCGAGSGNAGENSFDALYYLCKGWKPTAPRTKDSPHATTSSPFRGTNEASRVVLLFTDEPPHMPFTKKREGLYWGDYSTLQPGDDGYEKNENYCFNLLDQALKDAAVNLTIIGGNCYSSAEYLQNDKRYNRIVDGVNGDPDHREYKKLSNLSAFSGDVDLLRGLATNVAAKVIATDAKIVEPALEAYIRGGGTLRFDWRNDSTAWTNNVFTFTVDGVTNIVFDGVSTTLAGGTTVFTNYGGNGVSATWHRVAVPVDDGMHHFKWNYGKIDYDGAVSDCGIVSNIQWDPWKTELDVLPSSVDVEWDGVPITQTNDENTVVFDVACNSIWKVVDHSDWINVEQGAGNGDGNLVVSVATNLTYAERTGYVTVRAGEYGLPSDDILGKPEVTVSIVQKATPYNEDGTVRILTVDVKPRWPWNSKVDIDFRVQTPQKEGTPVTVKFWGLNLEGGDLVDDYPTLKLLRECPAKTKVYEGFEEYLGHGQPTVETFETTDGDYMVCYTCPTSGLYRLTWDMGDDWVDASEVARGKTGLRSYYEIWDKPNKFHTPEFAVRLQAQDEEDATLLATATSGTVRVDMRLASLEAIDSGEDVEETDDQNTWAPAGGRILTGWEKIGHPYGAVDPVPVDTRVQFQRDGWTRLDSIAGLPIPDEFAAISNRACVINNSRVAIEGGVITTDTIWGVDKVHVIRDNVFVASNATLTIEANAIVKFCDCARIFVHEFDNIVGEGGRHNIVVKGATFVHGYSHVGGDTLYSMEHDLMLSDAGGSVFAQPMEYEACENDVVAWSGEDGHTAICALQLWCAGVGVDPADEPDKLSIASLGQTRFYSYEQRLGNLQRPSREDCAFYGWYYVDPRHTTLTIDDDYNGLDYFNANHYEASKAYFIYPADKPFSLNEGEGKIQDTSDPRIYALFCAPDWVTDGQVKEDASMGTILLSPETVEYNGTEQKPAVKEVWIGGLQIPSANYTVNYGDGGYTDVGEYDVRVNFTVDYVNSPVAKFKILPRSNEGAKVAFSPASVMCDWDPVPEKPGVLVTLGMDSVSGYTVSWIDDNGRWPNPGKYMVVVSFNENFTGPSITNEFEVVMNPKYRYVGYPTEAEACAQVASRPTTDDGTAARRILYIGCRKDDALSEYVTDLLANDLGLCSYLNENFVCWSDDIDAAGSKHLLYSEGLASDIPPILAIVSANDTNRALASHSGYITREELVAFLETAKTLKEDASSATLELSSTRLDYTGGELKPSVTVRYADAVIPNDNYELEWSGSCTNSGVYEVRAVFNGIEYIGVTGTASFEIVPVALTASAVTLVPSEATYDGETHWPEAAEVEGVVFDIDYGSGDYTNVGTNTVKVTATGNYYGTITKSFVINPKLVSAVIELDSVRAEFTENKPPVTEVKPVVIAVKEVKQRRVYVEGVDYDLDWGEGDYMAPDDYTITAVFKGNYTGRATATFVIELIPSPGVSLPSLPDDATEAQVQQEIANVSWTDPDVYAKITNIAAYKKFQAWVDSLDDATRERLADSTRTYISSVVSEILETPYLLGDAENVELSITDFATSESDPGRYEVTIELKVGNPLSALKLKAAKEAFAEKVRLGTSLKAMAPAQESDIEDAESSDDKVVLTVVMPAGGSGFVTIKIE